MGSCGKILRRKFNSRSVSRGQFCLSEKISGFYKIFVAICLTYAGLSPIIVV